MAHNCRKVVALAPWKRLLVQHRNAGPTRNFWNLSRPADFRSLIRDMDRSMERLEREIVDHFPFRGFGPRVVPIEGVVQRGDAYRLNVDVDGFKPEEIKVSLKDNILTIQAKMDRAAVDGSKYYQEFKREFTLPENVDTSQLKSFISKNGILSLEAEYKPNPEEAPKELPVSRE